MNSHVEILRPEQIQKTYTEKIQKKNIRTSLRKLAFPFSSRYKHSKIWDNFTKIQKRCFVEQPIGAFKGRSVSSRT